MMPRLMPEHEESREDEDYLESLGAAIDYKKRKRSRQPEFWAWYSDYLLSPAWGVKRQAVLERARNWCEGCVMHGATQVHHVTYVRVGQELLFDLVALCSQCHRIAHSKVHKPWLAQTLPEQVELEDDPRVEPLRLHVLRPSPAVPAQEEGAPTEATNTPEPAPLSAVDRTWLALAACDAGATRDELAAALGVEKKTIGNRLYALKKAGRVVAEDGSLWRAVPVSTPDA